MGNLNGAISMLIFLLISHNCFGQIAPSKIKIERGVYHGYICKEESQCPSDEDTIEYSNIDSTAVNGKTGCLVYGEIIDITYPIITTSDPILDKFIKDTIEYFIRLNELTDYQKCDSSISANWKCVFDKPSETRINFSVTYLNSNFLSITISKDGEAGGGASGASYGLIAFTFDLAKRKLLTLKDIVKRDKDSTLYNIAIIQLKKDIPQFFTEFDNPSLFQFKSLLDKPFVISKDKITIYWNINAGERNFDAPVDIYFDNNTDLFNRGFLNKMKE
jgi:hypothetical protein